MILRFVDGYVNNSSLYFSAANLNGLFCYEFASKEIKYLGSFEGESKFSSDLHVKIVFYKEQLYCIPFKAKFLSIYDLKDGRIKRVGLPSINSGYANAHIYKDKLYMFPYKLNDLIICFDLEREEFIYNEQLTINMLKLIDNKECYCDIFGSCFNNNHAYIAIYGTSKVLKIDLDNNKFEEYNLSVRSIYNIECTTSGVFLVCNEYSDLFFLNEESGKLSKIDLSRKSKYLYKLYKLKAGSKDESIIIIGNDVTEIGIYKNELKVRYRIGNQSAMVNGDSIYMVKNSCNNDIVVCQKDNGRVLCIDDMYITEFIVEFDLDVIKKQNSGYREEIVLNEGMYSLSDFIKIV